MHFLVLHEWARNHHLNLALLKPDGFPKNKSPNTSIQQLYKLLELIDEIALLDFFTCTDVDGFTVAVDFVSAITFDF